MAHNSFSNVIGFDDAPFPKHHKGNVLIIGAVFAGLRFDGILRGYIRRDGANAADTIVKLIAESRFVDHVQLIMLQGITFGGFNVIDAEKIYRHLGMPILITARQQPDFESIRNALLKNVKGGAKKWKIIEKIGEMEHVRNIYIQRIGLTKEESEKLIEKFAIYSRIPEPIRIAHLIAGGIVQGHSRGRV